MAKKKPRRSFARSSAFRSYRKLFIIASEGRKTEIQYFALFNNEGMTVQVKCIKSDSKSAPGYVLKRMAKSLAKDQLKSDDEAWLVVDKDAWTIEQLTELYKWSKLKDNYGLALSNPNFEYWLLLHFEDGNNIRGAVACTHRLKKYFPDYDKGIPAKFFSKENIQAAVNRAKALDRPPCKKWPEKTGSTVYRLIENIWKKSNNE